MRLWICGARGSTPSPGAAFARFGGHTSCVAVGHDGERPSLILDAGTGIRMASDLFGASTGLFGDDPYAGAILLSHLHWDHTQGLPFFGAGNCDGSRVALYAPAQGDTEAVLERFMSPPHFPIGPRALRGSWEFLAIEEGETQIEGFSVIAAEIPHLGGRTFGYRIADESGAVSYLPDHCPTQLGAGPDGLGEYHEAALTLASGSDLVLHDAQYLDDELAERASFGHAAVGYAINLAARAGAKELMLFHHDPARSDDEIDALVEKYAEAPVRVSAAASGLERSIPA